MTASPEVWRWVYGWVAFYVAVIAIVGCATYFDYL